MGRPEEIGFYPSTCVPISRRRFLTLGAGALAAAGALAWRVSPLWGSERQWDEAAMRSLIDRFATVREDPWRIAHGIRARGKGWKLPGSEGAVDYILRNFTAEREVNGKRVLYFPPDVQPHSNLYLNNLLEAEVPTSFGFQARGRRRSLQDLVDGARTLFDPGKVNPNDLAWSLVSLSSVTPPTRGAWENAWGHRVELAAVVNWGFRIAEEVTADVRLTWRQGAPLARKSPIQDFTCGGTHLIYSLVVAVKNGYTGANAPARLRDQLGMLIYRMWADLDQIDRFYSKISLAERPEARWYRLDAKWKFLGHAFEVYNYALAHSLLVPTAAEARTVEAAKPVLRQLAAEVEGLDLEAVKRHDLELFRQFVGDACHAYRGVHLA